MLQTQPFQLDDFSGGFTDNYVVDGLTNKCRTADNLLILHHGKTGKLKTRYGSTLFDADFPQIPAGAQRIGTLFNYGNDSVLLIHSAKDLYYIDGSGFQTILGPTGNQVLTSGTTANVISQAQWNKHLLVASDSFAPIMKVYRDSLGDMQVRNAGLPELASDPTIAAGAVSTHNYVYAFVYSYEYTVDTVTNLDVGPTRLVRLSNSEAPNVSAVSISAIPVLSNGLTDNYDTANIKVKIYRTQDNGSTFYYVGEVTNGTTTFNDSVSDATLVNHELLYTTGGVVDNYPPLPSKLVHVTGNIGWYAHVKDGSQVIPYRIYQSIPGDIDAVPDDFYIDVEDEIVGLSSVNSVPIVLCKNVIYRLDGAYDELGRGNVVYKKISDTAGCISSLSVVQTLEGVFWAGKDGFYFTDGYRVVKITNHLDETFRSLSDTDAKKRRIYGKYEASARRIWWAVQKDAVSADVDSCMILDLTWGISDESPFTTASGGESFAPTALEFFQGNMIRADKRGYVFEHASGLTTDPKVDTFSAPSTWATETIIHDFTSCAFNFGTNFVRKWVPRIEFTARNSSNLSVQINSNNDDNRSLKALREIRFRGNIVWGDDEVVWGDPSLVWKYDGLIEEQRRFPATSLRCSYKQVQVTNAFTNITNSDIRGIGTVDSVAKTVVLGGSDTWPEEAVGYFIAFEVDNYTKTYEVTARTSDTITFEDALNECPVVTTQKWELKGYPKSEVLHLLSLTLHYALLGKTQESYQGAEGGNS
jgi:hypothetical protein